MGCAHLLIKKSRLCAHPVPPACAELHCLSGFSFQRSAQAGPEAGAGASMCYQNRSGSRTIHGFKGRLGMEFNTESVHYLEVSRWCRLPMPFIIPAKV